jgi:hypothetical protein
VQCRTKRLVCGVDGSVWRRACWHDRVELSWLAVASRLVPSV